MDQTWQGSTGVLLGADGPPLQAGGQPVAPVAEGIQELWRELAAAVPVRVSTTEEGLCGGGPDAPVRCWGFLRGTEGILVLANNTSASQELAVELRADPTRIQILRLRATGPAVTRQLKGVFRYTEEAQTRHQPAVYLKLEPGEMVALSLQMTVADWSWLRSVGKMAAREQATTGPPPAGGDKPWYERGRPGI